MCLSISSSPFAGLTRVVDCTGFTREGFPIELNTTTPITHSEAAWVIQDRSKTTSEPLVLVAYDLTTQGSANANDESYITILRFLVELPAMM